MRRCLRGGATVSLPHLTRVAETVQMAERAVWRIGSEPPPNVAPYVAALGVQDAVRVILAFGGSQVFLPKTA
jgi:hypothetical protein